jgi:GT2 family glycosyltransferase
MTPSVTVVVSTHDEGDWLWRTVAGLRSTSGGCEVVVVDDGSTDGSVSQLRRRVPAARVVRPDRRLGVAAARNRGAAEASGDVLVFADAHVLVEQDWVEPITAVLDDPEVGLAGAVVARMRHPEVRGYGLRFTDDVTTDLEWLPQLATDPYPVPALGGFFLGVRRSLFLDLGGFDEGMQVYGMEDPEICLRMWLLGYRCLLDPRIVVRHLFRVHQHQLGWSHSLHNILRMAAVHFGAGRLRELLAVHQHDAAFAQAVTELVTGDTVHRREWMLGHRVHDDDWFFSELNPALSRA